MNLEHKRRLLIMSSTGAACWDAESQGAEDW